MSAASTAASDFLPSSSFRFGSFSPDDVGKPQSSGLNFPMLSQQPAGQFNSAFAQGQVQSAPVQKQASEQLTQPPGPPHSHHSAPDSEPNTVSGLPDTAQPHTAGPRAPLASIALNPNPMPGAMLAGQEPSTSSNADLGPTAPAPAHTHTHLPAEQPPFQSASSQPVSPLPARADSSASTSSPGQYAHDGTQPQVAHCTYTGDCAANAYSLYMPLHVSRLIHGHCQRHSAVFYFLALASW